MLFTPRRWRDIVVNRRHSYFSRSAILATVCQISLRRHLVSILFDIIFRATIRQRRPFFMLKDVLLRSALPVQRSAMMLPDADMLLRRQPKHALPAICRFHAPAFHVFDLRHVMFRFALYFDFGSCAYASPFGFESRRYSHVIMAARICFCYCHIRCALFSWRLPRRRLPGTVCRFQRVRQRHLLYCFDAACAIRYHALPDLRFIPLPPQTMQALSR
jgi:hypothetical protein